MKTSKRSLTILPISVLTSFFLFLLLARPPVKVLALKPTPSDDDVNAIASQLFCPVCENVPLDVCDTEACRQWRALIRQMLEEGKSENEIIMYFAETYGIQVLPEPPAEGINWLAYLIPPLAFTLGAIFLFRAFMLWKRGEQNTRSKTSGDTTRKYKAHNNYTSIFQDELKKRR